MGKGISEIIETGRSYGIFFWKQESPAHYRHDTDFSTKDGWTYIRLPATHTS